MNRPVPIARAVQALDLALVEGRRWFRHKGQATDGFAVVDGWPVTKGDALYGWWLLARIPVGNDAALYQMPVVLSDDSAAPLARLGELVWGGRTYVLGDGGCDSHMVGDLVSRVRERRAFPVRRGVVQPETFDATDLRAAQVDQVGLDSSNTICRLDGSLMFKLYRCLDEAGRREADLLAALARQGTGGIPSVKAVVLYGGREGATCALALIQEWVSESVDAWRWLAQALASGPARVDAEIARMADAVAAIHRGLVRIGSRAWTDEDTQALKGRIRGQIQHLRRIRGDRLPVPLFADLDSALARVKLTEITDGGIVSPVHGDLHLGQMLRQKERYLILDFEGEPLASPQERLAWHSPLKDVAGMIRSFDYAAAFARRQGAPGAQGDWETWVSDAETRFFQMYSQNLGTALGGPAEQFGELLSLYLLEKATYEIGYELQSRPDWVEIPHEGLRRVLKNRSF